MDDADLMVVKWARVWGGGVLGRTVGWLLWIEQGVARFGESLDMQSSVMRQIKDALGNMKMLSLWRRRRRLDQRFIFCSFGV